MDLKALYEIGLSEGEVKVYLALLELGASSAGDVLEKAGVQNSVFHFCVNRLIAKGLVSYVMKNKFRVYSASSPESILGYVRDKERDIQKLIPELKIKQASIREKQEVALFEGVKGILTLLNILIEDAKKGEEFLMFTAEADSLEKTEEIQKFYEMYDAKRKAKGLVVKGIAGLKMQPVFERRKTLNMKYTDLPLPSNTGICGSKMVLINWGERPTGILIKSRAIVEREKAFFKAFWNLL